MYIIQIGANDGTSLDFMHQLIRFEKSKAIVIEPVPHVFEKLQTTYRNFPNVEPRQLAITDAENELFKTFYYLEPVDGEDYHDMYSLWGSFSKQHLLYFKPSVPNFDKLFRAVSIPCTTLNKLISGNSSKSPDILAIDTEGYDGKILESADLSLVKPELILFEHYHIPKPELFRLLIRLRNNGYACFSHGYDTLCFKNNAVGAGRLLKLIKKIYPRILVPRH